MLIKLGHAEITQASIQDLNSFADDFDLNIQSRMKKIADDLKVIAPKADDFLYFTCVMMHAAEASLIDDNGEIKKHADGTPVMARWEPVGNDSVRWVCSDPNIKPYRNSNRDIFPEAELKTAHKKWIGKPLCVDHQSQNAEAVRGCIVDTVYDDQRKRVIALCALDKKNHPKLARDVATAVSTNVSMGTAVGRAICSEYGCHRVARIADDFCDHMRSKSCYGEVNCDLNPLELSIVFSGADPKAKVKHIIAKDLSKAADSLTNYVEGKISAGSVNKDELVKIQEELANLSDRVKKLAEGFDSKADENDTNYGTTGSTPGMQPDINWPESNITPNPSETDYRVLSNAVLGVQQKIAKLQEGFEQLSNMVKSNEEPNMTTKQAYMQGTEEPKKYPVDPGNEQARNQDKHMVGASPFPGVGDVNGSYPGDEEKKKAVLRAAAEAEGRKAKRAQALAEAKKQLNKEAYPQGTVEPNRGGTTYTPEPGNEQARNNDDKQMVGASPFPGVGDINGLYGDDLKKKEMLARANWKIKFRKVSSPTGLVDKGASRWDLYSNDKLVLSATIDQITGGKSDILYDGVATKEFGKGVLASIKAHGFDTTAKSLLKNAQQAQAAVPPSMPASAPPAPGGDMGGAASVPGGDLDVPEGAGSEADKVTSLVEELNSLNRETAEIVSDLQEALGGVKEDEAGLEGVDAVSEDKFAEINEKPELQTFANIKGMQKTINDQLQESLSESVKDLKAHAAEIEKTKELYENRYAEMSVEQKGQLNHLAAEAVTDAKTALSEAVLLIGAVVKYAQGTAQIEKKAEGFAEPVPMPVPAPLPDEKKEGDLLLADDKKKDKEDKKDEDKKEDKDEDKDKKDDKEDDEDKEDKKDDDNNAEGDPLAWFNPEAYAEVKADEDKALLEHDPLAGLGLAGDEVLPSDNNEAKVVMDVDPSQIKLESGEIVDLTTKEGRAMYRTKLAQQGVNWSDMPNTAHPGGSVQPKLDNKPADKDAKFHTLQETHDKAMNNVSVKVKKQAEQIARLVAEGKLNNEDVDALVAEGVDKEVVQYYKKYWAEAKDPKANEFADKLTKEHAAQKQAEDTTAYKVKVKRAYELANQMVARGMLEESQIDAQVDDILGWNDQGFESMKNVVARQKPVQKTAAPLVGMLEEGDVILPSAQALGTSSHNELKQAFDHLFNSNRKTFKW